MKILKEIVYINCLKLIVMSLLKLNLENTIKLFQRNYIWSFIENQFDKNSLLINLGGGVIGDMGGFTNNIHF